MPETILYTKNSICGPVEYCPENTLKMQILTKKTIEPLGTCTRMNQKSHPFS